MGHLIIGVGDKVIFDSTKPETLIGKGELVIKCTVLPSVEQEDEVCDATKDDM